MLGRYAGRSLIHRLAGERRFRAAEAAVLRGGVLMLLTARLVPVVPFSLTGYVAGAARPRAQRMRATESDEPAVS